ncbi:hypothetical protein GCM10027061_19410 [Nesterenkonia suensis]
MILVVQSIDVGSLRRGTWDPRRHVEVHADGEIAETDGSKRSRHIGELGMAIDVNRVELVSWSTKICNGEMRVAGRRRGRSPGLDRLTGECRSDDLLPGCRAGADC